MGDYREAERDGEKRRNIAESASEKEEKTAMQRLGWRFRRGERKVQMWAEKRIGRLGERTREAENQRAREPEKKRRDSGSRKRRRVNRIERAGIGMTQTTTTESQQNQTTGPYFRMRLPTGGLDCILDIFFAALDLRSTECCFWSGSVGHRWRCCHCLFARAGTLAGETPYQTLRLIAQEPSHARLARLDWARFQRASTGRPAPLDNRR